MKRSLVIIVLGLIFGYLIAGFARAQSPPIPDKSPAPLAAPSKSVPFASPQAAQATPQAAYAPVPQYDPPAVVLQAAPRVYAVQRQVLLQAAPVAYAAFDPGCVAQQQVVVQRAVVQHQAVVNHGVVHQAQVNHAVVGAGVGRQPKKIKTKQVTRVKRGLFGR